MFNDVFFRLRSLLRRKAAETELDDELRFHFERQVQKYESSGLAREEALRRARLDFGGIDQVKEECREARGVHFMEELFQDTRYGLRMLRKSPGFTAVALLTLALGIGANTSIFSVVYGVLLRPLPYQDPARLIVLNETTPKVGMVSVSYPNFLDWRSSNHAFTRMTAVASVSYNLAGVNQPENISGEAVSPDFLSMLGVHPVLGRDFDPSEEKAGITPVVLVSYQLWQSHLGGDRGVVGKQRRVARACARDGRRDPRVPHLRQHHAAGGIARDPLAAARNQPDRRSRRVGHDGRVDVKVVEPGAGPPASARRRSGAGPHRECRPGKRPMAR